MIILCFFALFIFIRYIVEVMSSVISEMAAQAVGGSTFFGDMLFALDASLVQHPNISTLLLMGSFYYFCHFYFKAAKGRIDTDESSVGA